MRRWCTTVGWIALAVALLALLIFHAEDGGWHLSAGRELTKVGELLLPAGPTATQESVHVASPTGPNAGVPATNGTQQTTTTSGTVSNASALGVQTSSTGTGRTRDPQVVSNLLTSVRDLIDRRNYQEALRIIDDLLSENLEAGAQEGASLMRARLLAILDRKPEAIEILSALLESATVDKVFQEALAKYFILCRDEGVLAQHLARRELGVRNDPDNTRLLRTMAGLYEYAQIPKQELACRESLAAKERDIENLKRLVELYKADKDKAASAAETLAQLVSVDSANASSYLVEKAKLEIQAGDKGAARQTIDQMVATSALDFGTRVQVGRLQYDMGDYDRAVLTFEACSQQATRPLDQERCVFELARTRFKQGPPSDGDLNALRRLVTNSQSLSTRSSAARLLEQVTGLEGVVA